MTVSMKAILLRSSLAATLALAGFGLPAPCSGSDCPCAQTEPEPTSSCCPGDETCDACVYCAHCGTQSDDPQAIAPASLESARIRLAPVEAAPAIALVAADREDHGPPGSDRAAPSSHVSRHVPSVVLRV